jgi:hypothetical protein
MSNYFDSPEKLKELVGQDVDKAVRTLKRSGWMSYTYKGSTRPTWHYYAPADSMEFDAEATLHFNDGVVTNVYGGFYKRDGIKFDFSAAPTESRKLFIRVHERTRKGH